MSDEMPEAVPTETLIEQNRIAYTADGIFIEGDYSRIAQNRITKAVPTGMGTEATGVRVGRPGGRLPVGTEILGNAIECLTVGMNLAAAESYVAQNLVCRNRLSGITVSGDNNLIEANRIGQTSGTGASAGLTVSSVGNLISRNVFSRNWPFDLVVQNPTANDLVENECRRSLPPHLCSR